MSMWSTNDWRQMTAPLSLQEQAALSKALSAEPKSIWEIWWEVRHFWQWFLRMGFHWVAFETEQCNGCSVNSLDNSRGGVKEDFPGVIFRMHWGHTSTMLLLSNLHLGHTSVALCLSRKLENHFSPGKHSIVGKLSGAIWALTFILVLDYSISFGVLALFEAKVVFTHSSLTIGVKCWPVNSPFFTTKGNRFPQPKYVSVALWASVSKEGGAALCPP